jgi:hypothetical protein
MTLPSDAYVEPDNAEIYLNLTRPASETSIEGTLDGEFGHTFGPDE